MYIKELKVAISLEEEEINCIGFALLHDLRQSVENHYIHHELRVFNEQTKLKQKIGENFFGLLGLSDSWKSEIKQLVKVITNANELKEKDQC